MSNAPTVTITKGEPAQDTSRVIQRVQRLKLALAKDNVKPEKKKLLQAELDKHMQKIGQLKSELDKV